MPKPGTIYRIIWQAFHETEDIQCYVDISDNDYLIDDADTEEVFLLQGSGEPCTPSVIDNNEDPFTPVLAQQLTLKFESTTDFNMSTFMTGSDNRWGVHYYIGSNTKTIFKGFVVIDDLSEAILPEPNTVTLTCNDGLGKLRDIPLTDFDGDVPVGLNQNIEYLAWALSKTGLDLEFRIANNIKMGSGTFSTTQNVNFANSTSRITIVGETYATFGLLFYPGQSITISSTVSNNGTYTVQSVSGTSLTTFIDVVQSLVDENNGSVTFADEHSDLHFYEAVSLDAKTFEDEIDTRVNCRTVLEIILGENCRLFQMKGQWWIVRVDEIEGTRGLYVTSFDTEGTFIANLGEISFDKTIGRNLPICLSLEQSIATANRPRKSVRLNYNYEFPKEIPCNKDFDRGTLISDADPEDITYTVSCWTLREGVPNNYGTVDGTTAVLHKLFDSSGYPAERYVELTPRTTFESSSSDDATYIESEAIYLGLADKFTMSVDWKLAGGIATGGNGNARLFRAVLNGTDGSWWILGEDSVGDGIPKWFDTSGFTLNTGKGDVSLDWDTLEEDEWNTLSWSAPPVPVAGKLYIWLNQFNQLNDADDSVAVRYGNLNFDYIPLINGTYHKYRGQYHTTTQAGDYNAKREVEIFMGEPPRPLMKGAMFITGSDYILASKFFNAAVFPSGPPDYQYIHRYGEIQLFDVWNQVRDTMTVVQGTIQGLDLHEEDADSLPDTAHLVNKYFLSDPDPKLVNRMFILLSFNQNHDNQEWTGVFREVDKTTRVKDYSNLEFKLIYE